MAKKPKRPKYRNPHEAADDFTSPRNAAASRSWADMASREGSSSPSSQVSWEQRPRRKAPRSQPRPQRGRPQTLQELFGSWVVPTQRPAAKTLQAASTCVARHQRREVLFATQRTGAGSHARKIKFTNKRCK